MFTPWYSWNTAKVGVQHQSTNQNQISTNYQLSSYCLWHMQSGYLSECFMQKWWRCKGPMGNVYSNWVYDVLPFYKSSAISPNKLLQIISFTCIESGVLHTRYIHFRPFLIANCAWVFGSPCITSVQGSCISQRQQYFYTSGSQWVLSTSTYLSYLFALSICPLGMYLHCAHPIQ